MSTLQRTAARLAPPLRSLSTAAVVQPQAEKKVHSAASLPYTVPLRDYNFLLNEVLGAPSHYQKLGFKDATPDFVDTVNSECAKFSQERLAPLYSSGDAEGCVYQPNTDVSTPAGYREAYQDYASAGWNGLTSPVSHGGQGMPFSLCIIRQEMLGSANWPWSMYQGVSMAAINTLTLHASEEQKQVYLTKLISGQWTGTMCLTEPHCGTDLGQVSVLATPDESDGSYRLSGTKVYISGGEHDLAENIVHVVLARTPGAPAGTRGISLFIVPKHVPGPDGELPPVGERSKNVTCAGIEAKMGLKGSATCVMAFDNSKGWLIGKPNAGLMQMFTFMNSARLGTAVQGVCHMERAYQGALPWAMERASMRSLSGKKYPEAVADKIIVHPDVRKNLLTIKALAEGCRAMVFDAALIADGMLAPDEKARNDCDEELGLHTPTLKAFITERGFEMAALGMQIYGGAGFIKDYGMEQICRDAKIATIYEGTTGVQGLDLIGRKIIMDKGVQLRKNVFHMVGTAWRIGMSNSALAGHATTIATMSLNELILVAKIAVGATKSKEIVGSASTDFMMYCGYVSCGFQWLRMMNAASEALKSDPNMSEGDKKFYEAKIDTGNFYFDRIMPTAKGHAESCVRDPKTIMDLNIEAWDLATTLPSNSGQAYGRGFTAK